MVGDGIFLLVLLIPLSEYLHITLSSLHMKSYGWGWSFPYCPPHFIK
jgi:hypothetical protein